MGTCVPPRSRRAAVAPWLTRTDEEGCDAGNQKPRLHFAADIPQLRVESEVQRFLEVIHARGAARARFGADNPLHGLHVTETPEMKAVFKIDELFCKFVKIPVRFGVAIDLPPRFAHAVIG